MSQYNRPYQTFVPNLLVVPGTSTNGKDKNILHPPHIISYTLGIITRGSLGPDCSLEP